MLIHLSVPNSLGFLWRVCANFYNVWSFTTNLQWFSKGQHHSKKISFVGSFFNFQVSIELLCWKCWPNVSNRYPWVCLYKVILCGLYHGNSSPWNKPSFGSICLELFPSISGEGWRFTRQLSSKRSPELLPTMYFPMQCWRGIRSPWHDKRHCIDWQCDQKPQKNKKNKWSVS